MFESSVAAHDIIYGDERGLQVTMSAGNTAGASTSGRSTRPATPMGTAAPASPLEALVYNCTPSLAPSTSRRRTDSAAAREGRLLGKKGAESEANLHEASRKEKVQELVDWCTQVLGRCVHGVMMRKRLLADQGLVEYRRPLRLLLEMPSQ